MNWLYFRSLSVTQLQHSVRRQSLTRDRGHCANAAPLSRIPLRSRYDLLQKHDRKLDDDTDP